MRIVVYGPHRRVGLWEGDEVIDLNWTCAKYLHERRDEIRPYELADALAPADLRGFIESGARALDQGREALDYLLNHSGDRLGVKGEQLVFASGSVKLHPPLTTPGAPIACMGMNYVGHGAAARASKGDTRTDEEVRAELRKTGLARGAAADAAAAQPVGGFWKLTDTIAGHEDDVIYPARTRRFDYEGEVAVVIGKRARHVPASRANEYLWGVTTCVDWSIRDGDDSGNRTFRHAKNFDTSVSMGPSIVVGELDPQNVDMETRVNGQLRQQYNSRDMTYSFAEIVEFLSGNFSLSPGFVISGGCGPGTAMESGNPEDFLQPGHVVEFSNPRIGLLRNRIVKEEA